MQVTKDIYTQVIDTSTSNTVETLELRPFQQISSMNEYERKYET